MFLICTLYTVPFEWGKERPIKNWSTKIYSLQFQCFQYVYRTMQLEYILKLIKINFNVRTHLILFSRPYFLKTKYILREIQYINISISFWGDLYIQRNSLQALVSCLSPVHFLYTTFHNVIILSCHHFSNIFSSKVYFIHSYSITFIISEWFQYISILVI